MRAPLTFAGTTPVGDPSPTPSASFEDALADIPRLAMALCGTAWAVLSVKDGDRQWAAGDRQEAATDTRLARLQNQTLGEQGVFVVSNAADQQRPPLRFYAGTPLVAGGQILGTLAVFDAVPRPWNSDLANALQALGRQAVHHLHSHHVLAEREQQEQTLRRAVDQYRTIIDNAVEGIFQTTPNGGYLTANPMLARIYGFDSPAEMSAAVTDIEHQLYVDPLRRREFKRLLSERDAVLNFESQVYRKNGSVIWIRENARAVRDADGQLLGYEGTVEDVSERKRAEEALKGAREDLERRVEERTRELAQINRALQAEVGERTRAERALEQAHQMVLASAGEKKRFYRDVIRCITGDKLRLVDAEDIPSQGEPVLEVPLRSMDDYPALRPQLREVGEQAGMGSATARDLVLAVGEAATNAIKHGIDGCCTVYRGPDSLVARVSDRGEGIRSEDLPATLFQAGFSTKVSLGMGFTLMLELVNRLWLATEPEGTIVQMEKWIHPERHADVPHLSAWSRL